MSFENREMTTISQYTHWMEAYCTDNLISKEARDEHLRNIFICIREERDQGKINPMEMRALRAFFKGLCGRHNLNPADYQEPQQSSQPQVGKSACSSQQSLCLKVGR